MAILRTFIIFLLMLAIPVYGMAAVMSAPACERMNARLAESSNSAPVSMDHSQHAGHQMNPGMSAGHGAMQHAAMDDSNCKSDCPCCGSDCACSAALAIMRCATDLLGKAARDNTLAKIQSPLPVPFNNPYRPPLSLS